MKRLLLLVVLATSLHAQQGGYIAGEVHDRSDGIVVAAEVRVQSQETGARRMIYSDASGHYASSELAPGSYKITVRRDGFRSLSRADVSVIASKVVRVDFVIEVLPLQQEVTVSAAQSDVDPTASGLTLRRDAPTASLPENGRDIHALFALMPGATVTPASISAGGQFTVSGQRPNANSFWVDGVSGNVGMGIVSVPGALSAGDLPAMTTIGGTQSLASQEETERVELRAADFSADFGDRPGAQISIETRSGTNDFHGSVFGYIRPHTLDSLDWFARGAGLNLPSAFLNGFGGGFGGPLRRNRTYFFIAFEKTEVRDSALQVISVPSLGLREKTGPYQVLFDAFPQPQGGRLLNANESLGYSPLQKDATVTNRSLRLDQAIGGHGQLFARYSDVPSSSSNFDLGTAYSAFHWASATVGLNLANGKTTQELRFNYSKVAANSQPGPADTPGGDTINQALANLTPGVTRVAIEGVGQTIVGTTPAQAGENQFAGNYGIARHGPKHELRAGFAYEVLDLQGSSLPLPSGNSISIVAPGIEALLAGNPLGLTFSSGAGPDTTFQRCSGFAQDTVRMTDRLDLLMGLRWEVTEPDSQWAVPGNFVAGYWNGVGSAPVQLRYPYPIIESSWPSHWGQVAPRLGVAYHLRSPNIVLRAGAGLFYDTGLGSIISNTNPLNIWQYLPNTSAPVSPSIPNSTAVGPILSLPRVWEWKASLEKSLWEESIFSVSYSGSTGHKLLRDEATIDPSSGILESIEFTTRGTSNYNALLANFRANVTPNLFALLSYTWGHSIDTGSSDTAALLADGPSNKGTSSFDVRQVFAASLSYRTPSSLGRLLGGWTVSGTSFARTGFPFNVTTIDESIGLGFENRERANLVPGQPIWTGDGSVPGGRELNPAAFQVPAMGEQGTLGRNVLTGAGFFQIDASLRRQLRLYRGIRAEAFVSAFNVLNHPAFANPVSYLGSLLFGQPTSMMNLMLGSGSPTTGLTPLFQAGGPRTIELSVRFSF